MILAKAVFSDSNVTEWWITWGKCKSIIISALYFCKDNKVLSKEKVYTIIQSENKKK